MFYTEKKKREIYESLNYLDEQIEKLIVRFETMETTISALLKIATNKAKEQESSVTVTVKAPHGLRKDGTPKAKPGPKRGDF